MNANSLILAKRSNVKSARIGFNDENAATGAVVKGLPTVNSAKWTHPMNDESPPCIECGLPSSWYYCVDDRNWVCEGCCRDMEN